ncbi:hypothetical protein NEUTE1DRAFT_44754 [Neurospora tetrasperma FGSC 2508]|uniref:Uncharacterized protein n=1 Tax=Neurospora tetrasperma (strain FGSC 2508 / ATCC MYA-4615 / P0657) TaxID=510951 RepID=F8MRH0_NEUT8|nr:uncharacterized protein NEUTE1DRAFT_44754 [Neurospora tetrasperma FGSC 2508]EGO56079.1 hypothetical protein NEUTE1DRAFT_44754 [Neurospora tetrasperma FGSC 2508]EGZ71071.1 hypothetical protein NEUTE2DRAFT_67602 [Neurospora tetrasperma FGSC 2509]
MSLLSPKESRRHTLRRDFLQVMSTRLFMCGRCGHIAKFCHDHLRHLRRQHPCPQMKEPKMYECKTHGPTSLDMEEHITHLRDSSLHPWVQDDE